MSNESSIAASIAGCSERLDRLRQYLEDCRLVEAADDAHNVHVGLHRVRRQHQDIIEQKDRTLGALQQDVAREQAATQNAQRLARILQDKLQRQEATIAEHNRTIQGLRREVEAMRSNAQAEPARRYREGYTAGYAAGQDKIGEQDTTIRAYAHTIQNLRQDLNTIRSNAEANANQKYREGYTTGFTAGQQAALPPPQPQPTVPLVDEETRISWMAQLMLKNASSELLSSNLKHAIVTGNKDIVASILNTQNATLTAPALHLAALFGDVEIARLLLAYGIDVNGQCTASSDNGNHIYGVIPMHLAVGAQHESMIRLLHAHGGSFKAQPAPPGKKTSAPPLWLVSNRWLTMSGKSDSASVVRILRTMRALGWNVHSRLNRDGETMANLVTRGLGNRVNIQRAVLAFLNE